jgi:hypothetical protein
VQGRNVCYDSLEYLVERRGFYVMIPTNLGYHLMIMTGGFWEIEKK